MEKTRAKSQAERSAEHRLRLAHELREIKSELRDLRTDIRLVLAERQREQHSTTRKDHQHV
jgi:hypothetical protein